MEFGSCPPRQIMSDYLPRSLRIVSTTFHPHAEVMPLHTKRAEWCRQTMGNIVLVCLMARLASLACFGSKVDTLTSRGLKHPKFKEWHPVPQPSPFQAVLYVWEAKSFV